MGERFVILKDEWLLRGWSDIPRALVNWKSGELRELSEDAFYVAESCDGHTNFCSLAFLPKHRTILEYLLSEGIVRECPQAEEINAAPLYRKAPNPYLAALLWSITGRCNMNCRHCYMDAPSITTEEFSQAQVQNLIEQFEKANVHRVALTGGEPFLRADLPEIIHDLTHRKIGISEIFTNGLLVDDAILDTLLNCGHRPYLKISFDGCGTHDYMRGTKNVEQQVIAAIRRVKARGLGVVVISSIDQVSRQSLQPTYELLKELNVNEWWLGPPLETGRWKGSDTSISADEMAEICQDLLKCWLADNGPFYLKLWRFGHFSPSANGQEKPFLPQPPAKTPDSWNCAGVRYRPAIMHDGTLLPCAGYSGTSVAQDMPNILEQDLGQAWSDPKLRWVCDLKTSDVLEHNPSCAACSFFDACGLGCRTLALHDTGELLDKDQNACYLFHSGLMHKVQTVMQEWVDLQEKGHNHGNS